MKALVVAVAAVIALPLAAGCADEVRPESHTIVAVDLTGSFENAARESYVKDQVTTALARMAGSGTVTVLAFSSQVGTSRCVPPRATVIWAGNTKKYESAKEAAASQLLGTLPAYFTCANDSVEKKTSDVLGAFAEAGSMLEGLTGARMIAMVSDGCQNTYKIKTCKNAKMLDADWRGASLEALPDSLRPDLSGVDITMQGLAVNSGMEQTGVDALKLFYQQFAQLTSANSITFA